VKISNRTHQIFDRLPFIESTDQCARLILIRRRAAEWAQQIGSQCQKTFQRYPADDVLDMRIQPSIFVNDDDGR
jgi:hypothetical protein